PKMRWPIKMFGWIALLAILLIMLPDWPDSWEAQAQAIYTETLGKGDEGEASLDSILERLDIWARSIEKIEERPLTGHGMNIFRTIVNEPRPVFEPEKMIPHAHNWGMQIVLELGFPGLIFYLWLIGAAFYTLFKQWRDLPNYRPKSAAYTAALIAFMVYGLLDTISPGARPDFIFWILLAAIFRLSDYDFDQYG
ncbi:MAG: O-antigen ligase family protein, partial [Chloroflexota bacterium]